MTVVSHGYMGESILLTRIFHTDLLQKPGIIILHYESMMCQFLEDLIAIPPNNNLPELQILTVHTDHLDFGF